MSPSVAAVHAGRPGRSQAAVDGCPWDVLLRFDVAASRTALRRTSLLEAALPPNDQRFLPPHSASQGLTGAVPTMEPRASGIHVLPPAGRERSGSVALTCMFWKAGAGSLWCPRAECGGAVDGPCPQEAQRTAVA